MHRILTLAFLELKTAWRRPSLWVFLAILLFLNWASPQAPCRSAPAAALPAASARS